MNLLYFLPLSFLFFACKKDTSKENCVGNNHKRLFEEYPNFKHQHKAQESYIIRSSDSWTYSALVAFEKYSEFDYRLKTVKTEQDSFITERKISKEEWISVKSEFDSLNFWCYHPKWEREVIDGFTISIIGLKDSSYHHYYVYDGFEKDSILRNYQIKYRKIALNLLNMGGLEIPKKTRVVCHKLGGKKIGLEVFSPNHNFLKSFEVYLDNNKIELRQGVAEIILSESDLDKSEIKVKEVLVNDVELSYKAQLTQYFLELNKNKN